MSNDNTKTQSVTIELSAPIPLNGVTVNRLHLRRPKLKDIRTARLAGSDEEERELRLFALLSDCAPSDLEELDFADYRKLQETFQGMVGD